MKHVEVNGAGRGLAELLAKRGVSCWEFESSVMLRADPVFEIVGEQIYGLRARELVRSTSYFFEASAPNLP